MGAVELCLAPDRGSLGWDTVTASNRCLPSVCRERINRLHPFEEPAALIMALVRSDPSQRQIRETCLEDGAAMGRFTIRVELHHYQPGDYDRLHQYMAVHAFLRTIRSDTGQDFQTAILEQASCGQPSTALVRSLGDEGGQLLLVQSKAGVTCAGSAAP
jgi:hypothetical protein